MPNTARGGGITARSPRRRSPAPEGIAQICKCRKHGRDPAHRRAPPAPRPEVKRDFEFCWHVETVRVSPQSTAPTLSTRKARWSIARMPATSTTRDRRNPGPGARPTRKRKTSCACLMPSHAKNVRAIAHAADLHPPWHREPLDAMFTPVMQLRSAATRAQPGRALVSIDVNSGRATREHHIEDTALKTNLEARRGDRAQLPCAISRA